MDFNALLHMTRAERERVIRDGKTVARLTGMPLDLAVESVAGHLRYERSVIRARQAEQADRERPVHFARAATR